jgi:hypothetical protein
MQDEVWSGNEDRVYNDSPSNLNTYIRVNGADIALNVGDSFASAVKQTARDSGLGKFRVYLNGSELKPADAPDTITEGMNLELRPYDVAGH